MRGEGRREETTAMYNDEEKKRNSIYNLPSFDCP
jgi:hypothetical protein